MEAVDLESKDEALRSQIAIRCAKSAILLYSVKSSPNRHFKTTRNNQDEEKDLMIQEIRDLNLKLARKRIKNKKIKLCGLMKAIEERKFNFNLTTIAWLECVANV